MAWVSLQEQVTGISRWIFPFTTKLLPNTELQTSAANPDLPLNMNGRRLHSAAASCMPAEPVACPSSLCVCSAAGTSSAMLEAFRCKHVRPGCSKLLGCYRRCMSMVSFDATCAGRIQQPPLTMRLAAVALEQGAGQQRRSLQQAYTYDALRRLQYSPANGVITSSDFQQAFQTAITNSNAAGMVLTPGSYQVRIRAWLLTCACCSCSQHNSDTLQHVGTGSQASACGVHRSFTLAV